jgi:hypothetical protein
VVVTNNANEVIGSSGLPAGTYTLTATSSGNDGQTCSAISTVTITEPDYRIKFLESFPIEILIYHYKCS